MNAIRRVGLVLIFVAFIADIVTTLWNLGHGASEAGMVASPLFKVTGPYLGLVITSLFKVAMVVLIAQFVKRDGRVAVVYLVVATVAWYAPIHNITL